MMAGPWIDEVECFPASVERELVVNNIPLDDEILALVDWVRV